MTTQLNNTWTTIITKNGTEISISNNKYTFYLGDAFDGIDFSVKKQLKLINDAKMYCDLLNLDKAYSFRETLKAEKEQGYADDRSYDE